LTPADSSGVDYAVVHPGIIQQRLEMVSRKLAERGATLESPFRRVGCEGAKLTTQPVPHS
jgi:hypothetical protein